MPLLQGIIFDLDGTLVDSAPDIRQALNQTLEAHGRRNVSLDEVKSMVGDGTVQTINRAFATTGEPLKPSDSFPRVQEFIDHYRSLPADMSQIYPHTHDMLESFRKAGIKMGICTNKSEGSTRQLLDQLKLAPYFDFIAGANTFTVHKPHPGHVLGVIKGLGLEPANCVMVGDSMNDVLAAHGAGIRCIIVTHGYGTPPDQINADEVIGDFRELPKMIKTLGFTWD